MASEFNTGPSGLVRASVPHSQRPTLEEEARAMGLLEENTPGEQEGESPEQTERPTDSESEEFIHSDAAVRAYEEISLSVGEEEAEAIVGGISEFIADHDFADGQYSPALIPEDVRESMAKDAGMTPGAFTDHLGKAMTEQTNAVIRVLGEDGYNTLHQLAGGDATINAEIAEMIRKTANGEATLRDWKELKTKYTRGSK